MKLSELKLNPNNPRVINNNILYNYGYTEDMLKKCKSIFMKNGIEKILFFVKSNFNVEKVRIVTSKNKNYFYFISV